MPQGSHIRWAIALISCCAIGSTAVASTAAELWHDDWFFLSPATLDFFRPPADQQTIGPGKPATAVASAANGDVLFGAMSARTFDYQFERIGADGNPRWAANFHDDNVSSSGAYAIVSTDDGGALLALGGTTYDDFGNRLVRIDASGTRVWSRPVATGWIVESAADRIASAGCSRLSLVDANDGHIVWQRTLALNVGDCRFGGLAADASGNLYAAVQIGNGFYASDGYRVVKFDPAGQPLWDLAWADAQDVRSMVLAGSTLYLVTSTELRAVHTGDGSGLWNVPIDHPTKLLLSDDPAAEPIVIGAASVQRVNAATGAIRWSTPLTGTGTVTHVFAGTLLLATSAERAKIDLGSGTVLWSLASGDGDGQAVDWLGFGDSVDGTFPAIARSANGHAAPALLRRIDLTSGAIVANVDTPAIAQGIDGATLLDSSDAIEVGLRQQAVPALSLRSLHSDGSVAWQTIDPLDDGLGTAVVATQTYAALASDAVAVAVPAGIGDCIHDSSGWTWIALYDRGSGARRWRVVLHDSDEPCPWASTPHIDAAGNVLVSISAPAICSSPELFCHRSLYKLSALDGTVVWRRDESISGGDEGPFLYPQEFRVFGTDVVIAGVGVGGQNSLVQRYSGADGSVQWSTDVFDGQGAYAQIDKLDEHRLVVHGAAYNGDDENLLWAELDADTGAVAWSSSAPVPTCSDLTGCEQSADPLLLPGGDVLTFSERDYLPEVRRFHNDASAILDDWLLGPSDSNLTSWPYLAVLDPAGSVHLVVRTGQRAYSDVIYFLTGFDPETGAISGQQALTAYDWNAADDWSSIQSLKMPTSDRALAGVLTAHPTAPTTSGTVLFDTHVSARGDIALALALDAMHVEPGMRVGFQATATYTGDAPIAEATMMLDPPWPSGATDLACSTTPASRCALDPRFGSIQVSFDAVPGSAVTVHGDVVVLENEAPRMTAMAYGPSGLSEQDTHNNFARVTPVQSLFFDGFEGEP